MMSLFNSFDFLLFGVKFLFPLFFMFFILFLSLNFLNFNNNVMKQVFLILSQMVFTIKFKTASKFLSIFCVSIFMLMFLMNFSSIYPYTFSLTTQMSIVFLMSLVIWFSFILFSLKNNMKSLVSHKIPEGAPLGLSIFLFLIELVSEVIRPLTLSLRLVGNMIVGHVLLTLLFKLIMFFNFFFPVFLLLNTIEVLVCFIQAYIFFTLVSMYCSEI